MNLLRKFGIWLWNSKERLVLAFLVIILCYRVFMVVSPQQMANSINPPSPPRSSITINDILGLEPPPPIPVVQQGSDWRPLWRDPLWAWNMQRSPGDPRDPESGEERIRLLNIQSSGERLSARIQVGRSTHWYQEGENFFSFTLLRIDKDNECCDVFSEARNRPIEICIE